MSFNGQYIYMTPLSQWRSCSGFPKGTFLFHRGHSSLSHHLAKSVFILCVMSVNFLQMLMKTIIIPGYNCLSEGKLDHRSVDFCFGLPSLNIEFSIFAEIGNEFCLPTKMWHCSRTLFTYIRMRPRKDALGPLWLIRSGLQFSNAPDTKHVIWITCIHRKSHKHFLLLIKDCQQNVLDGVVR